MKATLTLYYGTASKPFHIIPDKLFLVEDIETYLATRESVAITEFQYVKHALRITLKVVKNESYTNPLKESQIKYIKIVNDDNVNPIYYFVENAEWRSQECVIYTLVMDVLNTFKYSTDYEYSNKTAVQREHRDRFSYKIINELVANEVTDPQLDTYYQLNAEDTAITLSGNDLYLYHNTSLNPLVMEEVLADGIVSIVPHFDDGSVDYVTFTDEGGETEVLTIAQIQSGEYFVKPIGDEGLTLLEDLFHDYGVDKKIKATKYYYRVVDKVPENINPVLYGEKNHATIRATEQAWYLVYNTNTDDDKLIDCYLVPENNSNVIMQSAGTSNKLLPENFDIGKNYYFTSEENGPYGIGVQWNQYKKDDDSVLATIPNTLTKLTQYASYVLLIQKINDTTLRYTLFVYDYNSPAETYQVTGTTSYIYVDTTPATTHLNYVINDTDYLSLGFVDRYYDEDDVPGTYQTIYLDESSNTTAIGGISHIDKTSSKLVKIIKLPYFPDVYGEIGGKQVIPNNYTVVTFDSRNTLKLNNLESKFQRVLTDEDVDDPIGVCYADYGSTIESVVAGTTDRIKALESKLYHSEFFIPKYVYDSFTIPLMMENIDGLEYLTGNPSKTHEVGFYTTSTMNSRFAFRILNYEYNVRSENDYSSFLLVARNNEAVLYNSAYLNYIRTGYNYDVKNKNMSNTMTWLGAGASMIGTVATTGLAVATGGLTIPMAIASGTGTAMSLASAISSTVQNERTIEQRLNSLKAQSVSVVGSDDLDLLEVYNGNKLLLYYYHASDEVMNLVYDLFYYNGYATKRMGVPSMNSRKLFNFIQCEPVLNIKSVLISKEIRDELYAIMRNGYTILHKYNNNWEFEQVHENLESNL